MNGSGERAIFLGLLLSLVALMLLPGLFQADLLQPLLYSLVLMAAVAATSRRRITIWIALALVVPAVGLHWVPALGFGYADVISQSAALLVLALSTLSILGDVLRQRRVTQDTLYGSICGYLLLGITWAILYGLLELLAPGSFVQNNEPVEVYAGAEYGVSDQLVYYSLVTMTTLGYGDITPGTPLARTLAVIQAMMGQLYVAILVARLVALQVAHSSES